MTPSRRAVRSTNPAPPEALPAEGERQREFTEVPTVGGVFDEEGARLAPAPEPEPDEHRMKKPER